MQPREPVAEPAPQPTPAPVALRGGKLRNRRARLILAMVLGVVGLLCLGGVGVAVSLYDEATEIKRTAPDAVVDNFLGAYLISRDDKEASLYQCKTGGDFSQIHAYRDDIVAREKQYSVGITVTWSSLDVAENGDNGKVEAELTRTISDQSGRESDSWQFDVVDRDGWRVCAARKLP